MFFATGASRRVQSSLLAGLETGQGCLFLITGEAGIGKTMQLHVLEAVLRVAGETVMVHDGADGSASWLDRLVGEHGDARSKPVVDLVDGAEQFSTATLERLVAALRMSEGKGFPARLVIAARSEIEPRLYSLVGAALATQASFNWLRLDSVDGFDVESLLLHRLRRAGYTDVPPITTEALRRIIDGSGGVPSRILAFAAREFDAALRRAGKLGAVDGRSRNRGLPMRRAAGAVSLPLLVAGAWMLLPTDVIRRAETSAGRFVVETFAGTPGQVAIEASTMMLSGASTPAVVSSEPRLSARAPEPEGPVRNVVVVDRVQAGGDVPVRIEPIIPQQREDDASAETPVAVVHGAQLESLDRDGDERRVAVPLKSTPVTALSPGEIGATPLPVIAPQGPDVASIGAVVAIVHPAAAVTAPVEMPRSITVSTSPERGSDVPAIVLAQASAPTVLTAEQILSLIRRGDEQLREGGIAGARLFYERAAIAGDAKAMRALARTFDPQELKRLGVVGLSADPGLAQFWVRKAEETEAAASARAK